MALPAFRLPSCWPHVREKLKGNNCRANCFIEYPDMWVWSQVPLGDPSPRPRTGGREGLGLEGRVLQLQWGGGTGGPSKEQLGPDPRLGALDYVWGLSISARCHTFSHFPAIFHKFSGVLQNYPPDLFLTLRGF